MKMKKMRNLLISAVALLLLIPAVMVPVFGSTTSAGITVYNTPDFDDLELGLKGHEGLSGIFAGNTADNKVSSGATIVKDPDPSHEGDQALQISLEPAATGTKTAQDFVMFNNRVCYITWYDRTTTNSLGETVYTGYFTDKGSDNTENERYGIQSTDNKATALVVDQSHADDVNQDFAITSNTITYIRTTCTIVWDGAATTDLFGNRAYFGYFIYKDTAFRVKSTDNKANCIILPTSASYDVSNDAAVLEALNGGENVYRNLLLSHDAVSYADQGKVVLQSEYYIPTGCIGTFWVQQSSFNYYLMGSRDTAEKSGSWLSYYTIDTRAGELTVQAFSSSASGKTKIALEKDTWITVSLAIDLVNGTMDVYVNNVLKDSGSFFVTLNGVKHQIKDLTFGANSWQIAKVNVNQGYPANLRGEIYLDNAMIHQYDDSQKVVFGESTNEAGEPAIAVAMELASGRSCGASLTDTVLVNANMTATPVYFTADLTDGLIAPLQGASIRLTSTGAIRFGTQVNSAKMAILQQMKENGQIKDLQIGTLIAPASYVTEAGSFTEEALRALGDDVNYLDVKGTISTDFPAGSVPMTEGYDALFDGVILDIEPADFNCAYAGVGYVKITTLDGTEHCFYSYEYDSATFYKNYARALSSTATSFIGASKFESYQDVLESFRNGLITVSELPTTTIENVQYTINNFFFQNTAGISMRLSYEGLNGWRFQAVLPTDAANPYDSFNNMGAAQSLAFYFDESYGDVTTPLTITTGEGYIRITEKETGSYVDISTTGAFNVQFYTSDGEAMNNINGVSLAESDGQAQIILSGSLKDASEEAIFGGGQRFDSANKRGLSLSLFTYDAYNTDGGKGTYTVIPLFMSTRGSGLFINRYERMIVDFDVTAKNQWTVALFNDLVDCYIYTTGDMTDALNGYSNLSGYATMPVEWAQGVMVCRYNPDFGTLDGTALYEKLSDIPGYESLRIGGSSGELAMTATTITKGSYLYQDGVRSYYYDGTNFYALTKKGNPAGYGVRQIVENMIEVGMKPNAVIIEALDYAWLNCTNDSTTAKQNLQNIKEIADWLHENDIKLMLYMGIGQMSANLAGVKNEYYVRADITIEVDETVQAPHAYKDSYTRNTNEIIWSATSDNPDAIGTNTQKYLDITNPEAVEWYMDYIWGLLVDIGADGCKLDFCETMPNHVTPLKTLLGGEYVQVGTVTVDYKWYDPTIFGEGDVHHAYPTYFTALFYQSMNRQLEEKNIPDTFHINTRGGGIGIQRNIIMWGGDQTRKEKNLLSHLLTTLNSGISGMPFCSYDMGGYAYDTGTSGYFSGTLGMTAENVNNTESLIYLRALQFTAFTTMIQVHGDVRNVYELKVKGYADDYVQTVNAQYVALHESLQSYIRKWSEVSCETGMPLVRHLALQYQDDSNTWDIDDQFMLGDAIMVAPIIKLYNYNRNIYLPEGKWQDMLTGEIYEVGAEGLTLKQVHADLDQVPVFLNMESEDYEDLLTVFNGEEWQAINRGYVFVSSED